MAEDFFKRFDEEMQRRHPAPAEAAPAVPVVVEAPRAGVPAWVWIGAGVLALVVVWWLSR